MRREKEIRKYDFVIVHEYKDVDHEEMRGNYSEYCGNYYPIRLGKSILDISYKDVKILAVFYNTQTRSLDSVEKFLKDRYFEWDTLTYGNYNYIIGGMRKPLDQFYPQEEYFCANSMSYSGRYEIIREVFADTPWREMSGRWTTEKNARRNLRNSIDNLVYDKTREIERLKGNIEETKKDISNTEKEIEKLIVIKRNHTDFGDLFNKLK